MKIVTLSDTHGMHDQVDISDGDILIHCGDICGISDLANIKKFNRFLRFLPHRHKIIVAGNHDWPLVDSHKYDNYLHLGVTPQSLLYNGEYLEDSYMKIKGIKIYGSPWQPQFNGWAFNLPRGKALRDKWKQIPTDTDILITHGPPYGILDTIHVGSPEHFGCKDLLDEVVNRIKPKYHIFGHVHGGYGRIVKEGITFMNTAICDEKYSPINKPFIFDY